jgi:hypothetical protein
MRGAHNDEVFEPTRAIAENPFDLWDLWLIAGSLAQRDQTGLVSGLAYPIRVDLRFGEPAGHLEHGRARRFSHDVAREVLEVLGQPGVGNDRDAQAVAAGVAGRPCPAALRPRAGARSRVVPVRRDLP